MTATADVAVAPRFGRPLLSRRLIARSVAVFAVVGLTVIAVAAFAPFFAGSTWRLPVAIGVFMGGAIGLVVSSAAVPPLVRAAVAVVVPLAFSVAVAVLIGGDGRSIGLTQIRDALVAPIAGWNRMLSVGVPAVPTADLVALPAAGGLVASALGVWLTLRPKTTLLPILPPFGLYLVGLLITASTTGAQLWLAAGFLALSLLLIFVQGEGGPARATAHTVGTVESPDPTTAPTPDTPDAARPHVSVSRAGIAVPVILAVCACATALTLASPLAGATGRYDPRSSRSEAPDVQMTLSPLVGLKRELTTNPAVPVFTVSAASGRTVPSRIRTAYLSDFDGVIWRDSDQFVRPPATISTGLGAAGRSSQTVQITLQQLPGPYLPVVGDPVSLEGDSLERGQTRGNVVNGGGSLPGRSYQVTALTSVDASDVRLKTALTGGPEWRAGDVELPPGLPDGVREASLTATNAASTPYDKAVALQNYVRQTAGYSLKPPPGESYAAVALLLSKQAPYTAAFAEQRASAFVVLARAVGLPARVAVGYRTPADKSGASTVTFTTADAHAWAEVLFDQYGWVPFEPTDVSAPDQQRPPDTPSGPGGDTPQSGTGDQAATIDPNLTDGNSGLFAQILLALAVLVGVVALAGATVVVIKRVRRHRRLHAAGAEMRIAGAWAESLDRLAENGLRPPLSATPSEVAASLTSRIGSLVAAPVDRLAPLLAAAVFSPDRRSLSEATSAWDCEADLARALGARRPILLRVGRYLDPRPLFPRQQRGWRLPTRLQTPHFVHRGAR